MLKALQKRQIPSALGTCLPCLLARSAQGVSIIKLLSCVLLDEVRVKSLTCYLLRPTRILETNIHSKAFYKKSVSLLLTDHKFPQKLLIKTHMFSHVTVYLNDGGKYLAIQF